jgi:hypothetical protein
MHTPHNQNSKCDAIKLMCRQGSDTAPLMAALCCALPEGKTPADVVCSQMSCDQAEATDKEQDPLRSSILLALADASLAQSAAAQVRPCIFWGAKFLEHCGSQRHVAGRTSHLAADNADRTCNQSWTCMQSTAQVPLMHE